MLGHFPKSHPDETAAGLASRYKERMGIRENRNVCRDLFGVETLHDITDLPCHLAYLERKLPPEFNISADEIIDSNTAFPYFSPFLTSSEFETFRNAMKGGISSARSFFTADRRRTNRAPEFVRFCYGCVAEDRTKYREAYWHRVHQLPSVHVCHKHNMFLENSSVRRGKILGGHFVVAENILQNGEPRYCNPENRDHSVLLWLSEQTQWLLDHPTPSIDRARLRRAYLFLLYQSGFASVAGMIRTKKLCKSIAQSYRRGELSECLGIAFAPQKTMKWVRRVVGGAASPIEHLILLHFLKIPVRELLQIVNRTVPWFENGPWPCLNPICLDYGESSITEVTLRIVSRRITGIFTCKCGYAYKRIGPDVEGENRRTPYQAIENEAWKDALVQLWTDPLFGPGEIKNKLFTTNAAMVRALLRAGLDPGAKQECSWNHLRYRRSALIDQNQKFILQRERMRIELQRWLLMHPDATRSEIRESVGTAIRWLQQHDRDWLMELMPPPVLHTRAGNYQVPINWSRVDANLAEKIPSLQAQLLVEPGRPRRVTKAQLTRALGFPNGLGTSTNKLPKTNMALDEFSEPLRSCAIRRMKWLINDAEAKGVHLGFAELLQKAGVRRHMYKEPEIARAIEHARKALGLS